MKTTLTILTIFLSTFIHGQNFTQGIKILLKEKTKQGNAPIVNETVKVIIDDSLSYNTTTNKEGYIERIQTTVGRHNLKVVKESCQPIEFKGVIVGEMKTAYVSIDLTCASYINSLTKKELKKLGYKRIDKKKN